MTHDANMIGAMRDIAIRLADAAAEATLPYFRSIEAGEMNKARKGFDPVTLADQAGERAMRSILDEERPDDAIQGEEYGDKPGTTGWTWHLDPIDGTRAYLAGLPSWTTLIGLVHEGKAIIGIIDQPYLGAPGGTVLIDRDNVSHDLSTRDCPALTDAILSTTDYFILSPPERGAFEHLRATAKLTRYGLDAYAYARLAAGTIDMVAETELKPHDVAALIPVVENAGGVVTDWRGHPASIGGQIVAASNQSILDEALISLRRSARDFMS